MAQMRITREQVLSRLDVLPAFPKTVQRILETVDDPQSNMTLLCLLYTSDAADE